MSPNRLASSHSAYLRQHADNPVDWYEWSDEPFSLAATTDRPIFLSIGYAACHWCHVMAHESFEDPEVAAFLNDNFVAIKVDREERPDVDALYMAATQTLSGHGGWPMSVFLTPTGDPFMAGTYYPPTPRHGQPSFRDLLAAMADAWTTQRAAVTEQATQLALAVRNETRLIDRLQPQTPRASWAGVNAALVRELLERLDDDGGFGGAPKFPRPSYVEALLVRWREEAPRLGATLTLDAMSRRGLYDHLAGGFARYSVDAQWHVPHFEKMLSDQALLALAYLRADRAAGGATSWRAVALDTLRFVLDELQVGDGYASSLDADSGGVEGAHATWTVDEVRDVLVAAGLDDDIDAALTRWRIVSPGEFDGRSIPRLADGEPFTTPAHLAPAAAALLAARRTRPQPTRDDKVVLEWNAMLAAALLESAHDEFVIEGLRLLTSLRDTHRANGHWWRTDSRRAYATAGDVGWMMEALVSAFEATGDDQWLAPFNELRGYLLTHYWDGEVPTVPNAHVGGGVFTSSDAVGDIIERPKEIFDGATPSAHAVVTSALARYALVTEDQDARVVADRLIELAAALLDDHAAAVPDLVRAFGFVADGREIVVPGERGDLVDLVRSTFVPSSVLVTGDGRSPLLEDRRAGFAYLCQRQTCSLPVRDTASLRAQINAVLEGLS